MLKFRLDADFLAGLLFILFGGWFCFLSLTTLPFGTPFRMGPGFFPVVLSGILLALGAVISVNSLRKAVQSEDAPAVPWRAVVMFPIALVLFGLLMRPLGLIIALAALCFCSAMAIKGMALVRAAILSAAITALCIAIFSFGLGINLPLLGDWLR